MGCHNAEPFSRAYRATSPDQLIGGDVAMARVGDFILENDRITSVRGIDAGRKGDLDKKIHTLAALKVGDTIEIALVRDKKPLKRTYRIVE